MGQSVKSDILNLPGEFNLHVDQRAFELSCVSTGLRDERTLWHIGVMNGGVSGHKKQTIEFVECRWMCDYF